MNSSSSQPEKQPPVAHVQQSDEALYREFTHGGGKQLIGELYRRYLHLVYGVCYQYLRDKEEAKDAAMQVFEQLMTKPATQEIRSFKDWLFILTKNHCLMILRKEKTRQKVYSERVAELQSEIMESRSDEHLHDAEEQERRFSRLRAALARLPDEQKQCIELFYYQDLSYQQISAETGYGLKQVKSYLQNGKRNLSIMVNHGSKE